MRIRSLAVALLVVLAVHGASANVTPMSVGPYLMMNVGTNATSIPTGYKTGVAFTVPSDFGASFYLPFSNEQSFGATFDLGYHTLGIVQRLESVTSDDQTFEYRYHYFIIGPNLTASAFQIGFNFGIPLGMSKTNRSGSVDLTYGSETQAAFVDIHVGADIPLFTNDYGKFGLLIVGSYGLTSLTSKTPGDNTLSSPKSGALAIGLNYMYSLAR